MDVVSSLSLEACKQMLRDVRKCSERVIPG